jgi:hypothetical protein
LAVLDSIDEQGEKLKEYTLSGSIGIISSLLKFVYNSCIITVGSRVFGYQDKQQPSHAETGFFSTRGVQLN